MQMYQALYRKYRPQTFDDVAGQSVITTTLKNQVISGKLSHAYLFTGSRGTGKTTCAKILAKAVNCENPVDGNPCNCCAACRGIDAGNILDVQEIDAASNNGVENVRSIRDDVVYPPAEVKKRVYIIDEVHMLSTQAFNAFLKTIEEPPEYLIFIFATTELNKVPATILSRCQRFAFRRPTAEDITGRIRYVAYQEGIDITEDASGLLGRLADGAFRDGLSLLDQCASAATGTLDVEGVYATLGLAGQQQTYAMMEAISQGDTSAVLRLFSELYSQGKDASSMLGELSSLARDVLVLQTAPNAGLGMISSTCTAQEALSLSKKFTSAELLRMIDLIQDTTNGFRSSLNQRLDGELCLMHLCQPDLTADVRDLSARLSRLEDDMTARILDVEHKLKSGSFVAAVPSPVPEDLDNGEQPPFPDDADAPPELDPSDADSQNETALWTRILEKVLPDFPQYSNVGVGDVHVRTQGSTLWLSYPQKNTFYKGMFDNKDFLDAITQKASVLSGQKMQIRLNREQSGRAGDGDLLFQLADTMQGYDNMTVIH